MAVVAAGGELEQTVVLKGPHVVTGRVTDARTGQPIPAFTVVPVNVFRRDFLRGERANAETGRDGALKFLVRRDDYPQRLRVEAMGYRTVIGREFKRDDDDARVQDFVLEPAAPVAGRVIDDTGLVMQASTRWAWPASTAGPSARSATPRLPSRSGIRWGEAFCASMRISICRSRGPTMLHEAKRSEFLLKLAIDRSGRSRSR